MQIKKGVLVNLFKNIRESIITLVTSRLFVLFLVFITLFSVLLYRLFELQIVNGENYANEFRLKIKKEKSIASTRGKIFDVKGELLAYNELAYSVTIEDVLEAGSEKNKILNATIYKLITMIEKNGDKVVNDFNIILNNNNEYEFALTDTQLLRFKADIYGITNVEKLTYAQQTATPDDIINFLAGRKKFAIGTYADPNDKESFVVGDGYTKSELLKMVSIRYAINLNSYQKYIPTKIATDVSDKTVAVVLENSDSLEGVKIAEDTIRKYVDSTYFSHIIGYTGNISSEELKTLSVSDNSYSMNDVIGKAGIEQVMESELQGQKGKETVFVDNLGRVIETSSRTEPVAGNDLHLTIDKNLQKAVYSLLEQKIAGILVSKIRNVKEYIPAENASSSAIIIPIDDVYYALINNSVIDISHFSDKNAKSVEKQVYTAYQDKMTQVLADIRSELLETGTPYKDLDVEKQVYESYIVNMLTQNNVINSSKLDTEDEVYLNWKAETISLKEYLNHIIAMNWIDTTKLNLDAKYSGSDEIYEQLLNYIELNLKDSMSFSKKVYKYMIRDNSLTGKQVCILLFEQKIIDCTDEEKEALENGSVSPYNFLLEKIQKLDVTPAQLALDPCSGSCVVTDVNTGEIRALVTYPSYDNNRLANTIDAEYYASISTDLSKPMWDYATQQKSAPGSTFKMISAVAGLEESVITRMENITCLGTWDTIQPPANCWISPSSHGALNIEGALEHSCNFFFFEVGYRLSKNNGVYDSEQGLRKLAFYADQFGLSDKSGIEITESEPQVSDFDAIRSSIGQGTHNYTTVGLARYVTTVANNGTCFNLSVIDKVTDSSGNVIKDYTPTVRNNVQIAATTWDSIHRGMRKVVESKTYYEGMAVNVAGKTGTAQESKSRANHALFVGYAPYENPEISIATRIAFGYASDYAAELSRDVFKYYYNLEDEESLITGTAEVPTATVTVGD